MIRRLLSASSILLLTICLIALGLAETAPIPAASYSGSAKVDEGKTHLNTSLDSACDVTETLTLIQKENTIDVLVASVQTDGGARPDADNVLNRTLHNLGTGAAAQLTQQAKRRNEPITGLLTPATVHWSHYYSIYYTPRHQGLFDLHTGLKVDLKPGLLCWQNDSRATYQILLKDETFAPLPEGYALGTYVNIQGVSLEAKEDSQQILLHIFFSTNDDHLIITLPVEVLSEDPYTALWGRIDGSTATQPLSNAIYQNRTGLPEAEKHTPLNHSTTYQSYDYLFGEDTRDKLPLADLIFVTEPYEAERTRIGENYELVPIALDALVFLNNAQNPTEELSREQLRSIYTGQVQNWADVGGEATEVKAFQRPYDSGSQTLFENLLMRGAETMRPPHEWLATEMGFLVAAVASYDNAASALGYSMYYYVTNMYIDSRVRVLAVDGILPSVQSIADGSYPLATAYYAVFSKDLPTDHPARTLVAWLLTEEGQEVVRQAGYVPLHGFGAAEAVPTAAVQQTHSQPKGTGGTTMRLGEPLVYEGGIFLRETPPPQTASATHDAPEVPSSLEFHRTSQPIFQTLTVSLPGDLALENEINAWCKAVREELAPLASDGLVYQRGFLFGNILRLHFSAGDTNRGILYDLKTGQEFSLSDIFFDGFEYAAYINSKLSVATLEWEDDMGFAREPVVPYPGIPTDYPYFSLYSDSLWIDLSVDSVLDSLHFPHGRMNPNLPLWHGISPWAGCSVELSFVRISEPDASSLVYAPQILIDNGTQSEAEGAINTDLLRLGQAMAALSGYRENPEGAPQNTPDHSTHGRYWSIAFGLEPSYERGLYNGLPAAMGQVYDLHTGLPMLSNEQALALWSTPGAKCGRQIEPRGRLTVDVLPYQPPSDASVAAIWFSEDFPSATLTLNVDWIEADGLYTRLCVPWSALEPDHTYTAEELH